MKLHRILTPALLAAAILTLTTTAAQAAIITWGSAQNITSDADVSLNGTLVAAFNFNGPATVVNTVTFDAFQGIAGGPGSYTVGNFTIQSSFFGVLPNTSSADPLFTGLSAGYRTLLGTAATGITDQKLTLGGLMVGQQYEFQVWASRFDDSYGTIVADTSNFANSVYLSQGSADPQDPFVGQFVIGSFFADAMTQDVFIGVDEVSAVNGFQLRSVSAVPEPTTALFGLALVGFCTTARRRTQTRA